MVFSVASDWVGGGQSWSNRANNGVSNAGDDGLPSASDDNNKSI